MCTRFSGHLRLELGSSNKNDMRTLAVEKDGIHDIFSSKGDPQIPEAKEDINMKVEKILELISAEEKDGRSEDHYKLVYLVENFYKNYVSLCGRYDNLVRKLEKHVINRKDDSNGSIFSGSVELTSDSETSESSEDKANYIKSREESPRNIESVDRKQVNTTNNDEVILEDVQKENEGLVSENIELSKKLHAAEEIARQREEENSQLMEENKAIKENMKDKIAELEEQMSIDCENYEGGVEVRDELIDELQVVLEEKLSDITQLENDKKQLQDDLKRVKSEKTSVERDTKKLREDIQTLEVEFCLSNQKYKVTKSEYKQKEEHHKKKIKEVQEKCRAVEQQNVDLFEEINYLEYEISQGKEALVAQFMPIMDAFQHLEVVSEQRCWNVQTRLFELSEELHATKEQFKRVIQSKQKELEECKTCLEDKDEEKRQAIRQLCLVSEYHRESCTRMSRSMSLRLSK